MVRMCFVTDSPRLLYFCVDDLARSRPQMMANHKAVNCLSFDPKFHHRLVSCAEARD